MAFAAAMLKVAATQERMPAYAQLSAHWAEAWNLKRPWAKIVILSVGFADVNTSRQPATPFETVWDAPFAWQTLHVWLLAQLSGRLLDTPWLEQITQHTNKDSLAKAAAFYQSTFS